MNNNAENDSPNGTARSLANGGGMAQAKAAMLKAVNGSNGGRYTNGAATTNGHSMPSKNSSPTYLGHSREEVSRLMIQALLDLGYTSTASNLVQESGFELESPVVAAFREAVLEGNWALAESLLFGEPLPPTSGSENRSIGKSPSLMLADHARPGLMRFWLRQQKFLELLETRETHQALKVLRTELTPVNSDVDKLHFLSSLLMCDTVEEMKAKAKWDGARGSSRQNLLVDLSKCISPTVMIAPHRLMTLLGRASEAQVVNCLYHNEDNKPSLLRDHQCGGENFPPRLVAELQDHAGEVWNLEFSHDGTQLATCGSEGKVIVWDARTFQIRHTLVMHEGSRKYGVVQAAWSPDDKWILTISKDDRVRLWDAETGKLVRVIGDGTFHEAITGCAWYPHSDMFMTCTMGKTSSVRRWDIKGNMLGEIADTGRIKDIARSPNGRFLAMIGGDKQCQLQVSLDDKTLDYRISLGDHPSSVTISKDSKTVLVGNQDGEASLYHLRTHELLQTFIGQKGGEFVIRCSFGGAEDAFVTSGSEDGHVFIWRKQTGLLVQELDAHHPKSCNAVAWNPVRHYLFASGGDDQTVKIWSIAAKSDMDHS